MQKKMFSLLIVCFTLLSGFSYGASANSKTLNTENSFNTITQTFSVSDGTLTNQAAEEMVAPYMVLCSIRVDRVVTTVGVDGNEYTTVYYTVTCRYYADPVLF